MSHILFWGVLQTVLMISLPCPLIPDMDIIIHEVFDIRISFEEPEELHDDSSMEYFLGCQKWESFIEIETYLSPEH